MKIVLLIVFMFPFLLGTEFIDFDVKENGKIKTYQAKKVGEEYIVDEQYSFKENSKLIVRFYKITPELVKEFENKYFLTNDQILVIGDYIYTYNGDDTIFQVIANMKNELNIKTITPLWNQIVKKR